MDKLELIFNARLSSVDSLLGRYIARLLNEADPPSCTEYTVPPAHLEQEVGAEPAGPAHAVLARSAGLPLGVAPVAEGSPAGRTCR